MLQAKIDVAQLLLMIFVFKHLYFVAPYFLFCFYLHKIV